jgi:histidinol dehydrogenase
MIFELNPYTFNDFLKRAETVDNDIELFRIERMIDDIALRGDQAVSEYAKYYDGLVEPSFKVPIDFIKGARQRVNAEYWQTLISAYQNIFDFHQRQGPKNYKTKNRQGVELGLIWRPFRRVGFYIPGGQTPLISTLLMLAVPARIAGVREIVVFTPSDSIRNINPYLLAALSFVEIDQVYCLGGAQAIGAATFGTESVPKVQKIFGPGSRFVDMAKKIVSRRNDGIPIDMNAGPSEVLIIADSDAKPKLIAADLLAQLEHGEDSSAIVLTDCKGLALKIQEQVYELKGRFRRENILDRSINNLKILLVNQLDLAFDFSEAYAPEHLMIQTKQPRKYLSRIHNAGSVFLGENTPETLGDYISGTNHILPTNGQARERGGVGVFDFLKKITYQQASKKSLKASLPDIDILTSIEGLDAHAYAAKVRFDESTQMA